ncbi:ankyrin repeat-containing domain protein [Paraphoma chrysanthemicola]|nr:ankyrin repeat-containing domain protein [Paraphoma chrysanthemicola]
MASSPKSADSMPLLRLPLELLYLVSHHAASPADTNALARCNRQLYELLNKFLYRNNMRSSDGSALMWAAKNSRSGIARKIFDTCRDIELSTTCLRKALIIAMESCSWGVMKVLIANGADANTRGGGLGHILQAASWKGDADFVRVLLEAGADVNAQAGQYGSALTAAAWCGHEDTVRLLIERGADVNAQSGGYANALQAASSAGHQTIVEHLICRGAAVNATGGFYGSALQAACWRGNEHVVKALLQAGANPHIQGEECANALLLTLKRKDITIAGLLCTRSIRYFVADKLPCVLHTGSIACS